MSYPQNVSAGALCPDKIRRLVIDDAGPSIPLIRFKRIGAYVGQSPVFDDLEGVEKYMREIYAPFGDLSDENWRHLARYGARAMPDNSLWRIGVGYKGG
jgi:hypothetical protein